MKQINVHDLQVGMFLVHYGEGSFDDPLITPNRRIETLEEIEELIAEGVDNVYIDPTKGVDVKESSPAEPAPAGQLPDVESVILSKSNVLAFQEELLVARKLYGRALDFAKSVFESIRQGKDFDHRLAEPFADEIIGSLERNGQAAASLATLRNRSEYDHTHCVNVSILSVFMGRILGLERPDLVKLAKAGLFMDVGKLQVDQKILSKPGRLSEKEFEKIKWHPVEGYFLLRDQGGVEPEVLEAILSHHERYDGLGYPRGVEMDSLSVFSSVLSISDCYDAMTSDRPFRQAMMPHEALKTMYRGKGTQFSPEHLEQFIKAIGVYPVGSFVQLTDGRYAVVADVSTDTPLCPTVKVAFDNKFRPIHSETLDLNGHAHVDVAIAKCLDPAANSIDVGRLLG